MKLPMMLLRKATCAPVASPFKGQEGSVSVMQPRYGVSALTLSEQHCFVCDTASQKHEITRYTRYLGSVARCPLPAAPMAP